MPATKKKPAKKPVAVPKPEVFNKKLGQMAQIKREIDAIEGAAAQEYEKIRAAVGKRTTPLRRKLAKAEESLAELVQKNKAALFPGDRRSLKLAAGTIGYRAQTSIEPSAETLDLLVAGGHDDAIRIKKEVDKTVLAKWSKEQLAAVKATRLSNDEFYCRLVAVEVEP